MKYIISFLGILSIIIVTIINFFPDKVYDFIEKTIYKKEYVIAKANDYYLENNYEYVKNYTDDIKNKEELYDYIYYVINTGSNFANGECTKDYENCINDLLELQKDEKKMSAINNFVHPYNNFTDIVIGYTKNSKKFSISVEHLYNKEEISQINYIVNNKIKELIVDTMTTEEKIKVIHDYIIDNTEYDQLKAKNIDDNTYKSKTAYGTLVQGYGVCSGYSDAMSIFLNELNIPNYRVSSDKHIWNLVYVNGEWLHLDTTWDDPISEFNENRDTYFLIDYNRLQELNDNTHIFDKNIFKEAY